MTPRKSEINQNSNVVSITIVFSNTDQSINSLQFTYYPVPILKSLNPLNEEINKNYKIQIHGENFSKGFLKKKKI